MADEIHKHYHLLPEDKQLNAPVLHYLAFWPFHLTYYLPAVNPSLALPLWASTIILIAGILISLLILHQGRQITRIQP